MRWYIAYKSTLLSQHVTALLCNRLRAGKPADNPTLWGNLRSAWSTHIFSLLPQVPSLPLCTSTSAEPIPCIEFSCLIAGVVSFPVWTLVGTEGRCQSSICKSSSLLVIRNNLGPLPGPQQVVSPYECGRCQEHSAQHTSNARVVPSTTGLRYTHCSR